MSVEHRLTEAEKQGALKTFFTKVKEELDYIPAHLQVIEHWQEKAVFENDGGAARASYGQMLCQRSLAGLRAGQQILRRTAAVPADFDYPKILRLLAAANEIN